MKNSVRDDSKLKAADGHKIEIEANNLYNQRKNLYHHNSSAGPYKTQTEENLKKAVDLNGFIAKLRATYKEERMFYDTVWEPAI